MCKTGIHLCNHALISTLDIFPGKGINSETWAVTTEKGPALPSFIFMGSSPLFVATMSSPFYFSRLSDAEVVDSLMQLTTLCKAGNGPSDCWRKLIVSEQMSHCWDDEHPWSQGLHANADILALHIRHNLILGTQKCLTGLQREPNHSVLHVKLTTQ